MIGSNKFSRTLAVRLSFTVTSFCEFLGISYGRYDTSWCMGTCSKSICSDPVFTDRPHNLSHLQQNNLQLCHLQLYSCSRSLAAKKDTCSNNRTLAAKPFVAKKPLAAKPFAAK